MLHKKSPTTIFGVFAILFTVTAPLVVLFLPMIQVATFRHDAQNILMTFPVLNYYLLSAASILLIGSLLLLAYKRTKPICFTVGSMLIVAGVLTYASGLSYIQIHEEFVHVTELREETTLYMKDMETIIYEYGIEENGQYIFIPKEGEKLVLENSPLVTDDKRRRLYRITGEHGIEYIVRAKEETANN
ncbi:hypothetical protein MKY84_13430 [Chryseomicrobium sp. FSL W7-1435]|uniref:hypothetical protein n=1 Tax=Chryseomicrobium sp. FSL W7-1435 TaxID=2921704 RepID=UPI00315B0E8D